jgi:acetyltransferase-like isoleucine patch superfamily enzyme
MGPDLIPNPGTAEALPDNVVVGEGSHILTLDSFAHYRSRQRPGVSVGSNTGVYYVYFDLGINGSVIVGNYCTLQGFVICVNSHVEIGDYALIGFGVTLADDPFAVPPVAAVAQPGFNPAIPELSIRVGSNTWVGTQATLLRGARIGDGAIIGARAVVDFEVPPNAIVAGNPARIVGWAK